MGCAASVNAQPVPDYMLHGKADRADHHSAPAPLEERLSDLQQYPDPDEQLAIDDASYSSLTDTDARRLVARRALSHSVSGVRSPTSRRKSRSLSIARQQIAVEPTRKDEALTSNEDIVWSNLTVKKSIGRGHYGIVYLAEDKVTSKQYAMKSIDKKFLKGKTPEEQGREIAVLQRVGNHPNIVRLHKTFQSRRHIYLLMEYCTGGDLFAALQIVPYFTEAQCEIVIRQLASALQHLHQCGIVHRDIKPENILCIGQIDKCIDADDDSNETKDATLQAATATDSAGLTAKLCDFGLSAFVKAQRRDSLNRNVGTRSYKAPEVSSHAGYGCEVDMWGLGLMAFILLAGYHPFDEYGESNDVVIDARVLECDWQFDDPRWTKVSTAAKDFISQLIVLDPSKRMTAQQALNHEWLRIPTIKEEADRFNDVELSSNRRFENFVRPHVEREESVSAAETPKHYARIPAVLEVDTPELGFRSMKHAPAE